MAGYIGTKAVSLSTTGADIAGDAGVSGALDVGGAFTSQGIDDNATSTAMTLDATGNVGIGTSSPSAKVHSQVNTFTDADKIAFKGYNNQAVGVYANFQNATTGTGFADGFRVGIDDSENAQLMNGENTAMTFSTNSTERMRIDSAGRVTMPYQPCFNVGMSNNFTPSGTFRVLPFNDTSSEGKHNIGGHYATSGGNHGKFIAPVAGRYFFHTLVLFANVPNGTDMNDSFYIKKNGSIVAFSHRRAYGSNGTTMSTNYFADHSSTILNLGAGDYVQIILKYSRKVHGNQFYSYFSGNLIG